MQFHTPTQSVLFRAPDPLAIRSVLPKSKLLNHEKFNIAVKHTLESTRVLQNMGFDVPAPINTSYEYPGRYKPFRHQRIMAAAKTMHRRVFDLSDPGTGKTASTLWAIDWLMLTGRVNKALILSPLSTLDRVWAADAFDVLMHRTTSVVYGPKQKRLNALKADADIYIMNHEGVSIPEVHREIATRPDIDLIVLDEASMFRNHQTKKYKRLKELLRPDMRVWFLTGTPCPNAPTDVWALVKLLNPDRVPKFFGQFEREVMVPISPFKKVPKPNAYKRAYEAMQPAVRFKKSECIDLPPVTITDRAAPISAEQQRMVKQMRATMKAEAAAHQVTAANAADRISKIRQILLGSVKDKETGVYVPVDFKPRLAVLKECIEQARAKVIVIVPFKGIIRELEESLKEEYSVGVLNGDVSHKRRNQIIQDFKETKDPHVLLCHPRVMSHGLNLTEADTTVFYGPINSNDEFQQVIERFNRTGQKNKMTIVRIGAHPVEWEIYKIVDTRKVSQQTVLDLYSQIVNDDYT
jgi:SNF2 family DNA or RNA helicase